MQKHSINAAKLHHKIRDFLNTLLQLDYDSKTRYDELATEKYVRFVLSL